MKKKIETSKLFVGLISIFGALTVIGYYILAWFDKSCDSAIGVAGITEILGAVLGYLIYQAKLKDSRNKYGVDENGKPWDCKENDEDE